MSATQRSPSLLSPSLTTHKTPLLSAMARPSSFPAPLDILLPFLLLLASCLLRCEAAANGADHHDFSKTAAAAGGATASVFFFLLPKMAGDSAKAVSKPTTSSPPSPYNSAANAGERSTPSPYYSSAGRISKSSSTEARVKMVRQAGASLYNGSKEAIMACLNNGTSTKGEAVACLYNESKEAMAGLYKGTKEAVEAFLRNGSKEEGVEMEMEMGDACPASCFRPNPVCGKDGVTYWCGLADAECAGAEVDHIGFCDFDSRETGSKGVVAVQSLLLVHTLWLMLAAFLVLLGVP